MDFAQQTTPEPITTESILPTLPVEPIVPPPPKESKLKKFKEKWSAQFAKKDTSGSHGHSYRGSPKKSGFKKNFGTIVFIALVAGVTLLGIRVATAKPTSGGQSLGAVIKNSGEVQTYPIYQDFTFQVYDKSKELSEYITYTLTEAQRTKTIVVKGQKANAVDGRIFLIINLKLVNDTTKSLYLNTRNYVRLKPSGSEDLLAAEINNDTVEIQPKSTKLTRIGFPVDENTTQFTLYVGELEGEKQEIHITFP